MNKHNVTIGKIACWSNIDKNNPLVGELNTIGGINYVDSFDLPGGYDSYVATGEEFLNNTEPGTIEKLILDGSRIILFDVTQEHKARIGKETGFVSPGGSQVFAITGTVTASGRIDYRFYDLPDSESIFDSKKSDYAHGSGRAEVSESAAPVPTDNDREQEAPPSKIHPETLTKKYVRVFLETMSDQESKVEEDDDDTQPIQQKWLETKVLQWNCWQASEHHGITPQAQPTYVNHTTTIIVYLDQSASGNFQWMYVETLGYMSVGGEMNKNSHDQRGWANGQMIIAVQNPENFQCYEDSPENVNNVTEYTSSVSFNVGVSTSDGGSASVGVQQSQEENISDWGAQLNDLNHWTFYQNNPWDSRKQEWQDSMVKYDSSKARYEIKSFPTLSTSVENYATMSVFYNDTVSTDTVPVQLSLQGLWNYVGIKNEWPDYEGEWWGESYQTELTYEIDLSLVTSS